MPTKTSKFPTQPLYTCLCCALAFLAIGTAYPAHSEETTVSALLEVKFAQPRLAFRDDTAAADSVGEFRVFRNTQAEIIKSRLILEAAAQRPDAARLDIVQNRRLGEVVDWLREHLEISFPHDGAINQVNLNGADAHEAAVLLKAVVEQ